MRLQTTSDSVLASIVTERYVHPNTWKEQSFDGMNSIQNSDCLIIYWLINLTSSCGCPKLDG